VERNRTAGSRRQAGRLILPANSDNSILGGPPSDIEAFISSNSVDEGAAADFRRCPPDVQRKVLARGQLQGAKNPSAALICRIKDARASTTSSAVISRENCDVDKLSKIDANYQERKAKIEAFFATLPDGDFTPEEDQMRDALLVFIEGWTSLDPPTLSKAGSVPEIQEARAALLPKGCGVSLREWIDHRIGGEVETMPVGTMNSGEVAIGIRGELDKDAVAEYGAKRKSSGGRIPEQEAEPAAAKRSRRRRR